MAQKIGRIKRFFIVHIGPIIAAIYKRYGRRRVKILGNTYLIYKGVFNPKMLGISEFMARNMEVESNQMVLDMCTGSGILAITAGFKAHSVIAVDINPAAARCAKDNVKRNGLRNVEVVRGDLFSSLKPIPYFNAIFIHPPFFVGKPEGNESVNRNDSKESFTERFFRDATNHLKSGGYIQMVYPSFASNEIVISTARREGWNCSISSEKKGLFGKIYIYKFERGKIEENRLE